MHQVAQPPVHWLWCMPNGGAMHMAQQLMAQAYTQHRQARALLKDARTDA